MGEEKTILFLLKMLYHLLQIRKAPVKAERPKNPKGKCPDKPVLKDEAGRFYDILPSTGRGYAIRKCILRLVAAVMGGCVWKE